jgi:hypothetical protein
MTNAVDGIPPEAAWKDQPAHRLLALPRAAL